MPTTGLEKQVERDPQLQQFAKWHHESENLLTSHWARWSKNTKLVKGVFPEGEFSRSKTRKRNKVFFRKIWAERWRVLAALYEAFLRDKNSFKLEGVDTFDDPRKARVLQKMVEYRKRQMERKDDLFLQFISAFQDIWDFCWTTGKMFWLKGEDRPTFVLYPPEQVFPDMIAQTPKAMQYVIFVNYLTKNEIEELGYDEDYDIDDLKPIAIPSNAVKAARFAGQRDPLASVQENYYPSPDKLSTQEKGSFQDRYEVWEVFWKEEGKIKFAVSSRDEVFMKKPIDSPFGNDYLPVVTGTCLIEAHKLIGEGFPEPLEGPQENLNHVLNMRLDELALAMNPMNIVNRYANVDLQSLVNVRPGGIALADDAKDAVERLKIADVTASAYAESAAIEQQMDEISMVTPGKQGLGRESKATVAQINQAEANAKIDLVVAIVGVTFINNFYYMLTNMIQRFETDKKIFRVANEPLRMDGSLNPLEEDILDIDDFEADIILEVGLDKVSRSLQIQQKLLVADKMIMANQSTVGLMGIPGAVPQGGVKFFNITKYMEEIFPDIGVKNFREFYFYTGQPQPEAGAGGGNAAIAGNLTPQIGSSISPTTPTGGEGVFGT
jgi:hypothetical protein